MYLTKTQKIIIAVLILFVLYKFYQNREQKETKNNDCSTNGKHPFDPPLPVAVKKQTEDAEWSYLRNRSKKSDLIEQSFSI